MVTWIPSIYPLYVSINIAYMDPMVRTSYTLCWFPYTKSCPCGVSPFTPFFLLHPSAEQRISDILFTLGGKSQDHRSQEESCCSLSRCQLYTICLSNILVSIYIVLLRFYIPIPWLYYNIAITWVTLESSLPLDSLSVAFRVSRWSWKVANTLPWSWSMWPTTIMNSSTRMLEVRVIIDSIDPAWKHGRSAPISADQPKIHET